MAVTIQPPEQIGSWSWLISFSSSLEDPTFYVYVNGKLYATTDQENIIITISPGETSENVYVEIFDSAGETPAEVFPGRLTLHWKASSNTDYYRIDECVDASWVERARVYDSGEEYFSWKTRFLEDVTEHTFRLVPLGTNGNEGGELILVCLMVRYPDQPELELTYSDATHKVTIDE